MLTEPKPGQPVEQESSPGQKTLEQIVVELAEEGTKEFKLVSEKIKDRFTQRMDSSKEVARQPKRLCVLDCSGGLGLAELTVLSDERLNSSNIDIFDVTDESVVLPESLDEIAGIIITGSSSDIVEKDQKPWIGKTEEFVRRALEMKIPVLGVCFGIQINADIKGREVPKNISGREMGIWKISVYHDKNMPQHPIFKGIKFQSDPTSGEESAVIETAGAHAYHTSYDKSHGNQLYGFHFVEEEALPMIEIDGSFIGVQFHPEFSIPEGLDLLEAVAKRRSSSVAQEGKDPVKMLEEIEQYRKEMNSTDEALDNRKFLTNFVDIVFENKTEGQNA